MDTNLHAILYERELLKADVYFAEAIFASIERRNLSIQEHF